LRKSLIEGKRIDEADVEESSSVIEEQFLAKVVDMKHIQLNNNDNDESSELIPLYSPFKYNSNKSNNYEPMIKMKQNEKSTVEYKFCVLFKGNIWYVRRTLPNIKEVIARVILNQM
jgi:hypothetical protein